MRQMATWIGRDTWLHIHGIKYLVILVLGGELSFLGCRSLARLSTSGWQHWHSHARASPKNTHTTLRLLRGYDVVSGALIVYLPDQIGSCPILAVQPA